MAGNTSKIQIEVRVDGKGGIKVLRQIGTESEKIGKKGSKSFRNMDRSVGAFNKGINLTHGLVTKLRIGGAAALAGISAIAIKSITQFAGFEVALNRLGNVSAKNIKSMRKEILGLPSKLGSVTNLTKGYYQVMSAGIAEADKSMRMLTVSAKMSLEATVAQGDAVRGLASVMSAYTGELKTATDAADFLYTIEAKGMTEVGLLIPYVGKLANVSKSAGLTLNEFGAALASITQSGAGTSESVTQMIALLNNLNTKWKELPISIQKYGSVAAAVKALRFEGVMKEIAKATDGNSVALKKMMESVEAQMGFIQLSKNEFKAYEEGLEGMTKKVGAFDDAWKRYSKTLTAIWNTFKNTVGRQAILLGEKLAPKIKEVTERMTTWIEKNDELIEQKTHEAIDYIADSLERLWKIASYNPAILKCGIVGILVGGTLAVLTTTVGKVMLLAAALMHLASVASVVGKSLGLVSTGVLDISQVANANFGELQKLVNQVETPDVLQGLQIQASELEQQIDLLKKATEGKIFTFRGDKEELFELQTELQYVHTFIKALKLESLDLISDKTINQAERLKQALSAPDKYYGALLAEPTAAEDKGPTAVVISTLSEDQIKAMQVQESFAIRMADAEAQRMRDREQLGLDMLESFRIAKMSETELALDALDKQFLAYDDFVQDESALYDWYVEKYNKIMEGANAKKLAMTEQMYSDLKFTSDDYYAYQLNQLQRQSDGYEKFTGNTALAHLWLTEQIKALDKERLDAADKGNQHLIDLSQRTADAMEDNFSSFYRDFFRGELDSAEDYFRKFCNSLTDSFSDMLGQMTKEALFGGGSSGSSGLFGSLLSTGVSSFFGGGGMQGTAGAATAAQQGMPVMVLHKGGRVGRDPAPTRNVPAFVFANAPRLHEGWPGLRKDEFPSILKYDETVLPPGVKPVNNVSNLTISVPVTIEGQGDDRLASKLSYEMEETAKRVMREEMR